MRVLACQSSVSVQRTRKKNGIKDIVARRLCGNLRVAPLCLLWSQTDEENRSASSSLFKDPTDAEMWPTLISLPLRHSVVNHLSSPTCHLGGHINDVLRSVLSYSHATQLVCSSAMDKEREGNLVSHSLLLGQVIPTITQFKVLWANEAGHHVKRPVDETQMKE